MKKPIIFDLDETLVDSEESIVWSFIKAGKAVGVDVEGMSMEAVIESAFTRNRVSRKIVEEFMTARRIVREYWRARVRIYPDAWNRLRGWATFLQSPPPAWLRG
ncbi:MAG: hypothetical protein QXP03_05130 [Desulfurococcaceae archaeon]